MNNIIVKLDSMGGFFPVKMINGFFRMLLGDKFGIVASAFFGFILSAFIPRGIFSTIFLIYWIMGLVLAYQKRNSLNNDGAFGKARFTSAAELEKLNLVTENGVVFGLDERNRIIAKPSSNDGHALFVGGSGTGKSSAHAIPTLLRWKGTGLVIDIKGELSEKTAHLHDSVIFSAEENLARYNPLAFLKSIEDVQELSRALYPIPKNGDSFWALSAQAVFSATAWKYKDSMSFAEVCAYLCTTINNDIIDDCMNGDTISRMLMNTVANLKAETFGSIMAEVRNKIMTFAVDERLHYATSQSDFEPKSIENKMIYLKITEKNLAQYGALLSIMISQFISYMTTRDEKQTPPILVLLDEFPRLGEIGKIVEGLATLRSRNVHLVLMIQSLAQLDDIYGREKRRVIVDNCGYSLVLNAKDTETQKYFSDLGGMKTAKVQSISKGANSRNVTHSEQSVPLIRPEEFATLEKPILFAFRAQPVPLKQAFYYKDDRMMKLIAEKERVLHTV